MVDLKEKITTDITTCLPKNITIKITMGWSYGLLFYFLQNMVMFHEISKTV